MIKPRRCEPDWKIRLGVGVEPPKRLIGANMILWRPCRDSILSVSFPGTSVPGSGVYRPCGTSPVASISLSGLGQCEDFQPGRPERLAKKLIWTSVKVSRRCGAIAKQLQDGHRKHNSGYLQRTTPGALPYLAWK